MESVHDNKIIKYEVNLQERIIIMYTQILKAKKEFNNKLVFSDVFAHYFENELFGSIILEVEKEDIRRFVNDNVDLLNKGKDYLWPMSYNSIKEIEYFLEEEVYGYYVIMSSYGLCGWILSKDIQICKVDII